MRLFARTKRLMPFGEVTTSCCQQRMKCKHSAPTRWRGSCYELHGSDGLEGPGPRLYCVGFCFSR
jgi:hypothetical protein